MTNDPTQPMTDADAQAVIEEYLKGRADTGVQLAQAVAVVAVRDGVLSVIFDPQQAGAEQWALLAVQPFEKLADFIATPLRPSTYEGSQLRARIHTIATGLIDGTSGGTVKVADLGIG
jgi:hypothetical protein